MNYARCLFSWAYRPPKGTAEKGTQVDLVIDRADQCMNLCEIKYSNDLFVISKDYERELRGKKTIFIEKTKSSKYDFAYLYYLIWCQQRSGLFWGGG